MIKSHTAEQLEVILDECIFTALDAEMHGTATSVATEQIMQLIDSAITEAHTPVTICGKSLEEVIVILNSLELERIADMKMTMSNLDKWVKLIQKDMHEATQKALNKMIEDTLNRGKSELKNNTTKQEDIKDE